jgi:phosphoribosyl-ATP pyrophosphohydrolase
MNASNTQSLYRTYEQFCSTTAIYPTEVEVEYLALGLASEAGELLDKVLEQKPNKRDSIISEASDLCWYTVRLLNACGVSFETTVSSLSLPDRIGPNYITHLALHSATRIAAKSGLVAGLVKKQIRDGRGWSGEQREEQRMKMIDALTALLFEIASFACAIERVYTVDEKEVPVDFDYLLRYNMKKLLDRKERGVLGGSGDNR